MLNDVPAGAGKDTKMQFKNLKIAARLRIGFGALILALIGISLFTASNMKGLSSLTAELYKHPYAVSTAILRIDADIVKMHRSMKDVALSRENGEIDRAIAQVDDYEKAVLEDIDLIEERFLGDETQVKRMRELFIDWKPIREEVISLMRSGDREKAAQITKERGASHLKRLYKDVNAFDEFASTTAGKFADQATKQRDRALRTTYTIVMVTLVLALLLSYLLARSIISPLNETVEALKDIAQGEGDLTRRITIHSQDEVGELAKWFNLFVNRIQAVIVDIAQNAETLSASSQKLTDISSGMAAGSEQMSGQSLASTTIAGEMSSNMTSIAGAMEQTSVNSEVVAKATAEMSTTINEVAENAAKARMVASEAVTEAESASSVMKELENAALEIGKVTETITAVSQQTNLLALNATIEAARAGDAGKGFAVVANEIKDLAQQTAQATNSIKEKITGIQNSSGDAVTSIDKISSVITDINTFVEVIAAAVEEQASTTKEIVERITEVSEGVQDVNQNVNQSSDGARKIASDISEVHQLSETMKSHSLEVKTRADALKTLSTNLNGMVGRFKYEA